MHIQQIVKISLHQQTTEKPSKPCFAFFKLISTITREVKKSTRRSHFDAYTGQFFRKSPNNRNAFQAMFCHVLSFFFATLIPGTTRKVKTAFFGTILMHIISTSFY